MNVMFVFLLVVHLVFTVVGFQLEYSWCNLLGVWREKHCKTQCGIVFRWELSSNPLSTMTFTGISWASLSLSV